MSDQEETAIKRPIISNGVYDGLKYVAQIGLPAVGALYYGLAQIWGFPRGEDVVGSITVIDLFLGALLGLSTKAYKNSASRFDGSIDVSPNEEDQTTDLNVSLDPYSVVGKKEVTLRVNHPDVA